MPQLTEQKKNNKKKQQKKTWNILSRSYSYDQDHQILDTSVSL